jgi:hypothetical protein
MGHSLPRWKPEACLSRWTVWGQVFPTGCTHTGCHMKRAMGGSTECRIYFLGRTAVQSRLQGQIPVFRAWDELCRICAQQQPPSNLYWYNLTPRVLFISRLWVSLVHVETVQIRQGHPFKMLYCHLLEMVIIHTSTAYKSVWVVYCTWRYCAVCSLHNWSWRPCKPDFLALWTFCERVNFL